MKIHALVFGRPNKIGQNTKANLDLLSESAIKLGHTLEIIHDYDCQMVFGKKPRLLIKNHKLENVNVLIVRANPSGKNLEFRSSIIKQFEVIGIPVINNALAVMYAKNKMKTLQLLTRKKVPIPKTYVVFHSQYIDDVIEGIGKFPVIIKSVSGSHGKGVSIVESKRALISIIDMITREDASEPVIVQEYVKESKGKDIRVFIVGKNIVGVMERIATKRGEFRSNFHLGGRVRIATLTKQEIEIAFAAVNACGLDVAGVDIIRTKVGPKVLEVNANPGLEGITKATGKDIAGSIIKYAVKKARAKK
ncbi:MAG: ribosomal protein S6 modification protein [Parcubacteria group bacterium GW2011_GWC2_39_14]|nr:MAG: ribosomal protein S6 modification protein [Parcubacteria group bacterium GW2011_GWC2_39_14]KKR55279.1 MAG: ribosomal protein S6 modification protein [Parcubacteria group bacterium GW2011_GWA2_40_23]